MSDTKNENELNDAEGVESSGLLADDKAYENELSREICELTDALGCPCEVENNHEKSMERIRELVAAEGKLGDCEEVLRMCWEKLPDTIENSRIYNHLVRLEILPANV